MPEAQFLVLSVNSPGKVREYKRRKHHTKDRLGCLACKQKRVKCDQSRPWCSRCTRNRRACVYSQPRPEHARPSSSMAVQRPLYSWTSAVAESVLFPYDIPSGKGTPIAALMRHVTDVGTVFSLPLDPEIWHLGCRHPHLLAAILAVSACHLRHHAVDALPHRLAEFALESRTLASFRPALAEPLTGEKADALLLTSMLLNTLSFALVDDGDDTRNSWVFSQREDRLGWLAIQMGLKPLLIATMQFREESLLWPIFVASDDPQKRFSKNCDSVEELARLPPAWVELITSPGAAGIVEMVADGNALPAAEVNLEAIAPIHLREPLRILAEIRQIRPTAGNVLRIVQFVGKLEPQFLALLYERDERALWMFGYWLGLLGRLNMWWSNPRASQDWAAIREYLVEDKGVCAREGREGEMWRELVAQYDCVGVSDPRWEVEEDETEWMSQWG